MSKMIAKYSVVSFKFYPNLHELEKKEKKLYEALAALLQFIQGGKKIDFSKVSDFDQLKKLLHHHIENLELKTKLPTTPNEPKFNVKHYERAILGASDVTYRDMAIQAAHQDLTRSAMNDLIGAIEKQCRSLSRQVHDLRQEIQNCGSNEGAELPRKNAVDFPRR